MADKPTVEEYLGGFEGEVLSRMQQMRQIIRAVAPEAIEKIAYGVIGYTFQGKPLVYFGGYAKHIGFYATPNGHAAFAQDLQGYKQGKGSVQFPHAQPLPEELIRRIVEFRVDGRSGIGGTADG